MAAILVQHLDASALAAGAITTWSDQSGAGNNCTASGSPTVVANVFNGLNAVKLNSGNPDYFTHTPFASFPSCDIIVFQQVGNGTTGQYLSGSGSSASAYYYGSYGSANNGAVYPQLTTSTSSVITFAGANAQIGLLQIVAFVQDGTDAYFYRATPAGWLECGKVSLGGATLATPGSPGYFGCTGAGPGALLALNGYLGERYVYTGGIPSAFNTLGASLWSKWKTTGSSGFLGYTNQAPDPDDEDQLCQMFLWQSSDAEHWYEMPCSYVPTLTGVQTTRNPDILDVASQSKWVYPSTIGANHYLVVAAASGTYGNGGGTYGSAPGADWVFTDQYYIDLTTLVSGATTFYSPHAVRHTDGSYWTDTSGKIHFIAQIEAPSGTYGLYDLSVTESNLVNGNGSGWSVTGPLSGLPIGAAIDSWCIYDGTNFYSWSTYNDEYVPVYIATAVDGPYSQVTGTGGDWANFVSGSGSAAIEGPTLYPLPSGGGWAITFDRVATSSTNPFVSTNTNPDAYKGATGTWSTPTQITTSGMANGTNFPVAMIVAAQPASAPPATTPVPLGGAVPFGSIKGVLAVGAVVGAADILKRNPVMSRRPFLLPRRRN